MDVGWLNPKLCHPLIQQVFLIYPLLYAKHWGQQGTKYRLLTTQVSEQKIPHLRPGWVM